MAHIPRADTPPETPAQAVTGMVEHTLALAATRTKAISTLVSAVDVPLNILYSPTGPTLPHLADLGVRRVSLGSLLYRRALGAALETVTEIAAGRTPRGAAPSYADVVALSRPSTS